MESMDAIVTAQNMIYKLSFSITLVNNNPHTVKVEIFARLIFRAQPRKMNIASF